ncbi:hypothetical protein N657DRAFT_667851 [Parathielavia appendiculata]|uniref:Uncharacterized protein n=1 Tax=Parathielavia appendiculata TaxID=2587402 RepID=A0AAN6Z7I4_9PEZI|nr:hypothetical protein N657DRAFT_667851 [Parathielavia appendiculata]
MSGVDKLNSQHSDALTRAVLRLLDTDLAAQTYSQIIDGVPLCDVVRGQQAHRVILGHPLENHVTLCPGVVNTARQFRANFSIGTLKFDTKLLEAFQAAAPDSRAFQLRLIELAAVAVHQIAVLYKQDIRLHDQHITNPRDSVDQLTWWRRKDDDDDNQDSIFKFHPVPPWPTHFTHPQYCYHDQYPNGLADTPWNTPVADVLPSPEPNLYLHSARKGFTFRLWQVKDEEQRALLDLLLSPAPASSSEYQPTNGPLPLLPTLDHRVRIDSHYAMYRHKVYRDIWERPEPTDEDCYFWDRRPRSSLDYPEVEDRMKEIREKGW